MAKQPNRKKLGEVIRFMDGPIEPISCVDKKYSGCNNLYKCAFRGIWKDVAGAISDIVDKITFEDLANKIKQQEKNNVYYI